MQKSDFSDRGELARTIVALLDSWGVEPEAQVALLALPADTRPGSIRQYRQGKPLPDLEALDERIEHLLGIADALRTSFPHTAQGGNIWMNRVNARFGDRTPLAAMLQDGMAGIFAVRTHLDCSYDWYVDSRR